MATLGDRISMPTAQSVGGNSHASSINAFNLQMRNQPWYQDWFRSQGLDPNRVKLSKSQRAELQQVIIRQGGVPADAFNDMKIDPAGNLNTEHGFASQPTWLKALEIGGAAAAGGYFLAPALTGAAPMAAPAASAAPAAAGTTAAATTGAGTLGSIMSRALPLGINAATNIYGMRTQANANRDATAAQLQAGRDSIAYMEARDKQAREDAQRAEALNLKLYNESLARREPFRQFGVRSLAQLGQPIPGVGTLGARMGA